MADEIALALRYRRALRQDARGNGRGVRRRFRAGPQQRRDRQSDRFRVRVRQVSLPDFPAPTSKPPSTELADEQSSKELLDRNVRDGLAERLTEMHARRGDFDETPYFERLDREMPVIREMGFSGYMLIVADFINYARSIGIPVGPGRGSVVGSLVSYALAHHRSRSDRAQAAVRALAQSRAAARCPISTSISASSAATKC